jgi:hypothetical protein
MHPGVAETAVIGTADELTGQAVYAFATLKPYVSLLLLPFISTSLIFSAFTVNSNTTRTTKLLSSKNSYYKSEK